MNTVLQTRGLTKSFGDFKAVDSLDLTVERGDIYGFLGRNGAGKTTTIRMLLGMIGADGGTIELLGQPVGRDQGPWSRVGSLVESAAAWPDQSVVGNLRTLADLQGLEHPAVDRVLGLLDLQELADKKARHLSLGNLQRLALALALLPEPEILILDEPINGLDPAGVVQVRELLLAQARAGTTVFVSSHLLDEVARTCSRIGILHQGRLVQELDRADLEHLVSRRLLVESPRIEDARVALARAGFPVEQRSSGALDLGAADPQTVAPVLVAAGVPLTRLAVESEDLEDYFLRVTGGPQ